MFVVCNASLVVSLARCSDSVSRCSFSALPLVTGGEGCSQLLRCWGRFLLQFIDGCIFLFCFPSMIHPMLLLAAIPGTALHCTDVKDVGYVIVSPSPTSVSYILITCFFTAELRLPEQLRRLYSPHWPYRGTFIKWISLASVD